MIDSRREVDLWGLEWVVGWEVYGKEEDAALEWTIALQHEVLISHPFFGTKKNFFLALRTTEAHTGPMIVACQWN